MIVWEWFRVSLFISSVRRSLLWPAGASAYTQSQYEFPGNHIIQFNNFTFLEHPKMNLNEVWEYDNIKIPEQRIKLALQT